MSTRTSTGSYQYMNMSTFTSMYKVLSKLMKKLTILNIAVEHLLRTVEHDNICRSHN